MNMRRSSRHSTMFRSKLLDAITKEVVGNQLDISERGLCMHASTPCEPGSTHLLELMLPWKFNDLDSITFEAVVHWCEKDQDSDNFAMGLELVEPDESTLAVFNFIQEKHCLPS